MRKYIGGLLALSLTLIAGAAFATEEVCPTDTDCTDIKLTIDQFYVLQWNEGQKFNIEVDGSCDLCPTGEGVDTDKATATFSYCQNLGPGDVALTGGTYDPNAAIDFAINWVNAPLPKTQSKVWMQYDGQTPVNAQSLLNQTAFHNYKTDAILRIWLEGVNIYDIAGTYEGTVCATIHPQF